MRGLGAVLCAAVATLGCSAEESIDPSRTECDCDVICAVGERCCGRLVCACDWTGGSSECRPCGLDPHTAPCQALVDCWELEEYCDNPNGG